MKVSLYNSMFSWFSAIISPNQGVLWRKNLVWFLQIHRLFNDMEIRNSSSVGHWRRTNVQLPPHYLKHGNRRFSCKTHFLFTTDKLYLVIITLQENNGWASSYSDTNTVNILYFYIILNHQPIERTRITFHRKR